MRIGKSRRVGQRVFVSSRQTHPDENNSRSSCAVADGGSGATLPTGYVIIAVRAAKPIAARFAAKEPAPGQGPFTGTPLSLPCRIGTCNYFVAALPFDFRYLWLQQGKVRTRPTPSRNSGRPTPWIRSAMRSCRARLSWDIQFLAVSCGAGAVVQSTPSRCNPAKLALSLCPGQEQRPVELERRERRIRTAAKHTRTWRQDR